MEIPIFSLTASFAMVVLAAKCTATEAGIFSWEPAPTPAPVVSGADHAVFRSLLENPQFDAEPFWERDQRWSETLKKNASRPAPIPLPQPVGIVPDIRLTDWMGLPELSLAFAPLSLGGGLLLLRRKLNPLPATG